MGHQVKIGTHNGSFHCDEVLACSMLKHLEEYSYAEIVRTRNMDILNDCDIVVDVGGVFDPACHRYDHHQRSFSHTMNSLNKDYPWTIKLSSAGLVYFHFGHQIIANILNLPCDSEDVKSLFSKIYETFILEIDAQDNGVDQCKGRELKYKINTQMTVRVHLLNPFWNDKESNEEECFKKACKLVQQEFLDHVHFYAKVWLPARDIVKTAILNRHSVHPSGEIVELPIGDCPWKEHLFELEKSLNIEKPLKFVIFTDAQKKWTVQCVPLSSYSFENRLPLQKEWCGLRDEELSTVSGISDCNFVHANGFIGGHQTRQGVLQMALKTLNF